MKYEIAPVIDENELLEALQKETELFNDIDVLASFLWEGEYMNDCFKRFWFDEVKGESLRAQQINFIVKFLKQQFPNYEYVLVDVSW